MADLDKVYPHTRGGTGLGVEMRDIVNGLSPHAWGNQELAKLEYMRRGSIPTRVGEP